MAFWNRKAKTVNTATPHDAFWPALTAFYGPDRMRQSFPPQGNMPWEWRDAIAGCGPDRIKAVIHDCQREHSKEPPTLWQLQRLVERHKPAPTENAVDVMDDLVQRSMKAGYWQPTSGEFLHRGGRIVAYRTARGTVYRDT